MIKTCEYNKEKKQAWDAFLASCKTPLFFFKRDFLEYHADRFTDASFMFYKDDALIALFPASRNKDILTSHGGLTYGGFLLSEKARSEDVLMMVIHLAKKSCELGFNKIIYKALPYLFYKQGNQDDLYAISTILNAKIFKRDLSSVIYLDNRMQLSKNRKRLVEKAKKLGLAVSHSRAWASFHQLLIAVLKRHQVVPTHSLAELEYLAALFPDNITLKTVEAKGILLAGAVLFKFHNTVHTQYLALSEEGKSHGALDFLIETCIEESRMAGYQYFSFGASTEQQGQILNSGLISQKEGFGARGVVLDSYLIELGS